MDKAISRKTFIGMLVAAVMCIALLGVAAPQDAYAAQGWNHDSKGYWYEYDSKGHCYKNGWQKIDKEWYYFQSNGYTKRGWIKRGGYWYFLTEPHYAPNHGPRMAHGAAEYDAGKWYFFDKSGRMVTGARWIKYDWAWIYLTDSGVLACNCWKNLGGKWYYFGSDGYRGTNVEVYSFDGFRQINGKMYYFDKNTAMATGWRKVAGKWYYMNSSGVRTTGWQKISGKWYHMSSSGVMQTGWQKIGGKWYYFANSGVMQKSKWVGDSYLQADGSMATNTWIGRYHVDKNGKWDKTRSGSLVA